MTTRASSVAARSPRPRAAGLRLAVALAIAGAFAPAAPAARRSEKQLEMDRQREEMRRQAEEKRQNPNAALKPPVIPSRSSSVFAPLVVPPPSTAAPAPAVPPGAVDAPRAPASANPAPAPDRSETKEAPRPASEVPAASGPAPADAPGEVVDDDLRKDESFRRGAGLFNSALELFKKYETGRDVANLATIPDLCEKAASAFEAAGASRPDDKRIARYVEQCHGLARYARQSTLMESGPAPR